MINATNNSAVGASGSYVPLSALLAADPGRFINEIESVFDSFGAVQSALLNTINIKGVVYDPPAAAPVPEPVVGAGIPGLVMAFGGFLAWRRRKAAIAA